MESLMTVKEAAQYLRINYMTVYKLAQKGRIPAAKVGGNWRFKKETLDDALKFGHRGKSRGTVLIVDDDAMIRDTLRDIVTREEWQAVTAENGNEALEKITGQHFDLIFLDLVLPGLSGVELMKRLKTRGERAIIAVVTGYGDTPIAMEAMAMGPLLLIPKPFRVADVVEVLNMVASAKV